MDNNLSYLPPMARYGRTAFDFVSGSSLRTASCLFESNTIQAAHGGRYRIRAGTVQAS